VAGNHHVLQSLLKLPFHDDQSPRLFNDIPSTIRTLA